MVHDNQKTSPRGLAEIFTGQCDLDKSLFVQELDKSFKASQAIVNVLEQNLHALVLSSSGVSHLFLNVQHHDLNSPDDRKNERSKSDGPKMPADGPAVPSAAWIFGGLWPTFLSFALLEIPNNSGCGNNENIHAHKECDNPETPEQIGIPSNLGISLPGHSRPWVTIWIL
jgi:hypothetical protein